MSQISESQQKSTSNGAGRKIRLHGHVVTTEQLHEYVLNLINDGVTGTTPLSKRIGKKERQTKRILDQMADAGLIDQNPDTGRIIKTKKQEKIEFDAKTLTDNFKKIPEIQKFIHKAEARSAKPKTISCYLCDLKKIFTTMKTHPASVIVSRESAEEFFDNYTVEYRKEHPTKKDAPHGHRVAYRIFLDSVANISYGHGMAGSFGSHHDAFQKYKGAVIPLDVCHDLQKMMLEDKEYLVYSWFSTGIMTGARSGGLASMTWDRINLFKDDFRLDQFETKDDSAGHEHLGELGEWKQKHPPTELYEILLEWKNNHAPKNSNFVWFEASDIEKTNRHSCHNIRNYVIPKLKEYLTKVKDRLSPITQEYIFVAGEAGHLNRHTFVQLMRNGGAKTSEIAFAVGMTEQTVEWYSDVSEDEKEKSKKVVANVFSKGDSKK